jgi:hypothetical protein
MRHHLLIQKSLGLQQISTSIPDGERRLVENDKRVAFVFLNTNPNAHFIHDNVSIPVVEGTLVHFNGAVPHQTIFNAGVVRLLGPIYSNDFAATLGMEPVFEPTASPAPSDGSPSDAPSESPSLSSTPSDAPSDAPSESPSISSTPSDAPSDAPSESQSPLLSSAPSDAPSESPSE